MTDSRSRIDRLLIAGALLCSVLAILLSMGHCALFLYSAYEQNANMGFLATIGPGMTQQECLNMHGPPDEVFGPGETIRSRMFPVNEPRTDQGTVWIYYLHLPKGVMLYFDENGRCVRIRFLVT